MFGSMAGNLMGILYFLLFQFMGIIIASLFLKKEKWDLLYWPDRF